MPAKKSQSSGKGKRKASEPETPQDPVVNRLTLDDVLAKLQAGVFTISMEFTHSKGQTATDTKFVITNRIPFGVKIYEGSTTINFNTFMMMVDSEDKEMPSLSKLFREVPREVLKSIEMTFASQSDLKVTGSKRHIILELPQFTAMMTAIQSDLALKKGSVAFITDALITKIRKTYRMMKDLTPDHFAKDITPHEIFKSLVTLQTDMLAYQKAETEQEGLIMDKIKKNPVFTFRIVEDQVIQAFTKKEAVAQIMAVARQGFSLTEICKKTDMASETIRRHILGSGAEAEYNKLIAEANHRALSAQRLQTGRKEVIPPLTQLLEIVYMHLLKGGSMESKVMPIFKDIRKEIASEVERKKFEEVVHDTLSAIFQQIKADIAAVLSPKLRPPEDVVSEIEERFVESKPELKEISLRFFWPDQDDTYIIGRTHAAYKIVFDEVTVTLQKVCNQWIEDGTIELITKGVAGECIMVPTNYGSVAETLRSRVLCSVVPERFDTEIKNAKGHSARKLLQATPVKPGRKITLEELARSIEESPGFSDGDQTLNQVLEPLLQLIERFTALMRESTNLFTRYLAGMPLDKRITVEKVDDLGDTSIILVPWWQPAVEAMTDVLVRSYPALRIVGPDVAKFLLFIALESAGHEEATVEHFMDVCATQHCFPLIPPDKIESYEEAPPLLATDSSNTTIYIDTSDDAAKEITLLPELILMKEKTAPEPSSDIMVEAEPESEASPETEQVKEFRETCIDPYVKWLKDNKKKDEKEIDEMKELLTMWSQDVNTDLKIRLANPGTPLGLAVKGLRHVMVILSKLGIIEKPKKTKGTEIGLFYHSMIQGKEVDPGKWDNEMLDIATFLFFRREGISSVLDLWRETIIGDPRPAAGVDGGARLLTLADAASTLEPPTKKRRKGDAGGDEDEDEDEDDDDDDDDGEGDGDARGGEGDGEDDGDARGGEGDGEDDEAAHTPKDTDGAREGGKPGDDDDDHEDGEVSAGEQ